MVHDGPRDQFVSWPSGGRQRQEIDAEARASVYVAGDELCRNNMVRDKQRQGADDLQAHSLSKLSRPAARCSALIVSLPSGESAAGPSG